MTHPRSLSALFEQLEGALDSLDHASRASLAPSVRLELVEQGRHLLRRFEALVGVLVAEADVSSASLAARGTPLTSWLALSGQTSRGEAAGVVFAARDVARSEQVREAALAGTISVRQARGIAKALADLPAALGPDERAAAEHWLLEQAATSSAEQLGTMGEAVVAAVAPAESESEEVQRRLEQRVARARRERSLSFHSDGRGSTLIRGSLPTTDAAPLIKLVDSYAEALRRRARDRLDPRTEATTPEQRRADALMALVAAHQAGRRAPGIAGDRPRVVVVMREEELRLRAEATGVLDSGAVIGAGDLRRLCCDCDVVPVVLGGRSEVLDVGVTQRLVTPAIRRALSLRDGGCRFLGCEVGDAACDAHHVVPWWAGGVTSLGNLVLLCSHHHKLVEPPRFFGDLPPDRWEIRMDAAGLPEVIPPARVDRERRPISCGGWAERARAG